MGSADFETICITVADYHSDHKHLRTHMLCALLKELLYKIVGEFAIGIDSRLVPLVDNRRTLARLRRMTFNNYDERHLAAERLRADAQRLENVFRSLFSGGDYPVV